MNTTSDSFYKNQWQMSRRDQLRAAKRCINGPLRGNVGMTGVIHGPPVKGGKCQRCVDVWEKSR